MKVANVSFKEERVQAYHVRKLKVLDREDSLWGFHITVCDPCFELTLESRNIDVPIVESLGINSSITVKETRSKS